MKCWQHLAPMGDPRGRSGTNRDLSRALTRASIGADFRVSHVERRSARLERYRPIGTNVCTCAHVFACERPFPAHLFGANARTPNVCSYEHLYPEKKNRGSRPI